MRVSEITGVLLAQRTVAGLENLGEKNRGVYVIPRPHNGYGSLSMRILRHTKLYICLLNQPVVLSNETHIIPNNANQEIQRATLFEIGVQGHGLRRDPGPQELLVTRALFFYYEKKTDVRNIGAGV